MGDRLMCCETSAHASDCPNNPNSLGFDEPGLWMVDEWIAEAVVGAMHKPSDADLFAVVRRGVESGTIKGTVVRWCRTHNAESIENHGVGLSDECWRVVWVPHDEPEGVGNGYALCRIVERLVVGGEGK